MEEVAKNWRKLRNEELKDFYSVTNIMSIESVRISWEMYVARTAAL
jgi:hypothetical protein